MLVTLLQSTITQGVARTPTTVRFAPTGALWGTIFARPSLSSVGNIPKLERRRKSRMARSSQSRGLRPASTPPVQEQDSSRGQLVHKSELTFSGPLPPPSVLASYEELLPGAADRIITLAEKQLEHRMYLEKSVVDGGNRHATEGVIAAVTIEAMFIGAACYLAHLGLGGDAIKVMGASAVGLLGAFGFGTISRRNERTRKQKQLTQIEEDQRRRGDEDG